MKITRIHIYQTDLPYVGRTYVWGTGNEIEKATALVVAIDTGAGLQDCDKFTPCGENFMVAHSEGRAALARLVAHFAAWTPPDFLQNTTDLMNYKTRSTGIGGPVSRDGKLYAPDTPGLGVTPDFESLGAPVAEYDL
ncbi:hypothetical protein [Ruegeria sp. MALMAid1280]|uniref:hypothetical protein n=1 Tax=Ruegeria sp. MALMAid1280 TaxID=3411634 RepID=UPI003BA24C7B